jgi:hypothetical protein
MSLECALYSVVCPISGLALVLSKRGAGTKNSKRNGSSQRGRFHSTLPRKSPREPLFLGSRVLLEGSSVNRSLAGGGVEASVNDGRLLWVCPAPSVGGASVTRT